MIHAVLALGLLGLYSPSALLKETPDSICPVLEAKQDFNKLWFQGQWLTQGMWRGSNEEEYQCSIFRFKLTDENYMEIIERTYDPEDEVIYETSALARNIDPTTPACWEFKPEMAVGWNRDFLILDTDYFDYAFVYTCAVSGRERDFCAWVMSKTPFPDKNRIAKAVESANRFGFNETDFIWMDRYEDNCYEKMSGPLAGEA